MTCLSEAGVTGIHGRTRDKEGDGIHTIEVCIGPDSELDLIFTMNWSLRSKKDVGMRITDPNGEVTLRNQTRAHIEVAQFREPADGVWVVEVFTEGKGTTAYGLSVVLV